MPSTGRRILSSNMYKRYSGERANQLSGDFNDTVIENPFGNEDCSDGEHKEWIEEERKREREKESDTGAVTSITH